MTSSMAAATSSGGRAASMSLEEIFLQLTGEEAPAEMVAAAAGGQN